MAGLQPAVPLCISSVCIFKFSQYENARADVMQSFTIATQNQRDFSKKTHTKNILFAQVDQSAKVS
jgi:hypothetical protein